jgi:hypothetical protein
MRIIQGESMDVGKTGGCPGRVQISDRRFGAPDDAFHLEQWDVDLGYFQYIVCDIFRDFFCNPELRA